MDDVAAGRTAGRSADADEQKPTLGTAGIGPAVRGVSGPGMNPMETGMLRRPSEVAGRVSLLRYLAGIGYSHKYASIRHTCRVAVAGCTFLVRNGNQPAPAATCTQDPGQARRPSEDDSWNPETLRTASLLSHGRTYDMSKVRMPHFFLPLCCRARMSLRARCKADTSIHPCCLLTARELYGQLNGRRVSAGRKLWLAPGREVGPGRPGVTGEAESAHVGPFLANIRQNERNPFYSNNAGG